MRAVVALLRWRAVLAVRLVRDRELARLAVVAAFGALGAAVMVAEYRLLLRAFAAIGELGVAGPPLTLYVLEAFFALLLVLGVLSSVATGAAVFFRAAENRLLLSTPLPLRALFLLRGLETGGLTSWAFVLLGAPALGALGVSYHRAAGFYTVAGALLAAFLVFTGSLGTLLTMGLGTLLGRFRSRLALVGLAAVLLGAAGALVGRAVIPTRADFAVMFEPGMLNGTTIALHFVEDKFARWPSHPFAAAVFALATQQGSHPGRALLQSGLWPLLALAAAGIGGGALYRRLIWHAAEGVLVAGSQAPRGAAAGRRGAVFPRVLHGPIGALVEKELVTLARSPEELARGAFVLFLLLLYTLFFLRVPVPDVAGTEEVRARLAAFSLLAAGYFLTTLALRVAFPALSVEGRAVWILLAGPVRVGALLRAKLALYSVAGFLLLGGIALAGGVRLGLPGSGLGLYTALLALMSVTIVAVALACGVLWPDFRGRPADALATSGGGLLATGLCLAYVAACGWVGYRLLLGVLTGAPPGRLVPLLALAVGGSMAAAGIPLAMARRRLGAFEAA